MKQTLIGLIIIVLGVVLFGVYRTEYIVKPVSATPTPIATPSKAETIQYDSWYKDAAISPDGNYVAYLYGYQKDKEWKMQFWMVGQNPGASTDWWKNGNIKEGWTFPDAKSANEAGENFLAIWSPNSKRLAAIINKKLYVWTFVKVGNELKIDKQEVKDFSKPGHFDHIYFSASGDKLFMSGYGYASQIYPETKQVASHATWPLPNAEDYIYWQESGGIFDLVAVRGGQETVYKTPIDHTDSANTIMVSPDGKYVCVETQASGYYGYTLFALGSTKEIFGGQEYSWCERWIDNRTVVVKETPYDTQWMSQYYQVDLSTKKKTLLGNYRNSK